MIWASHANLQSQAAYLISEAEPRLRRRGSSIQFVVSLSSPPQVRCGTVYQRVNLARLSFYHAQRATAVSVSMHMLGSLGFCSSFL